MSIDSENRRGSADFIRTRVIRRFRFDFGRPLMIYMAVALFISWPVILHPFTQFIGDIPDAYQYSWYLGWFWHAISHGLSPVYALEMNYPHGFGFMYNTSIIALSVLFGWLVPITSPVFVYNLVFVLNLFLIGLLGQHLLRLMGVKRWLSTLGGAMFCFMPYLTTQNTGHLSITFVSPLFGVLILLTKAISGAPKQHTARYGFSIGALLAVEFYVSIEVTVTFLLATAVFLGCLVVQREGRSTLATWRCRLPKSYWLSLLVTGFIMTIPGVIEFFLSNGVHVAKTKFHPGSENWYVADLLSPFYPTRLFMIQSTGTNTLTDHFTGNLEENGSYIGPAMFTLMYLLRKSWRGLLSRTLLCTILTLFILSLGVALHVDGHALQFALPWFLFAQIPFLDAALPVRLALYVDIGLIIWTTLALQRYIQQNRNGSMLRMWTLYALGSLAVLMWLPVFPYPHAKAYAVPNEMIHKIGEKPVFWITPNFGYEMQSLASSGYRLKAYNLYGFAPHKSLGEQASSTPLAEHFYPANESITYWTNQISVIQKAVRPGYILLTPFDTRNAFLPATLSLALNERLGAPKLQSQGYVLWYVK